MNTYTKSLFKFIIFIFSLQIPNPHEIHSSIPTQDSKGVLNFDFKGSLNVALSLSSTIAPSDPLIPHDSSMVAYTMSNRGLAAPALSVMDPVGSDNVPGERSFW